MKSLNKYIEEYIKDNNYDYYLDIEEEKELFKRYRVENNIEARDKLFFHNIRLVNKYIQTKKNYLITLTEEEIYQQAAVVTLKSIDKFDYTKDLKFTSYLYKAFQNNIDRYIMMVDRIVRIPIEKLILFSKIMYIVARMSEELGSSSYVTYEMIKEHINISKKDYLSYITAFKPIYSLNKELGECNDKESTTLLNVLSSNINIEEDYQREILLDKIYSILDKLDNNEKLVIEKYILDNKTYIEIEKETGIAKDILIRYKKSAIKSIRKAL